MQVGAQTLEVDYTRGLSIAIALDPHGPQPAFFVNQAAGAHPLRAGNWVGDVRAGGSCNAEVVELVPHCHGTHTECLGHVTAERNLVQDTIYAGPVLARLISLTPAPPAGADDSPLFTPAALQQALGEAPLDGVEALIIRSWPIPADLTSRDYSQGPPYPVLDLDATRWLAGLPLKHLLMDTPSLDPAHDGGRLANHRAWWGLDDQPLAAAVEPRRRSVTEMTLVPAEVPDGDYWLHIELSPLLGDATPSRPIIYPVERL